MLSVLFIIFLPLFHVLALNTRILTALLLFKLLPFLLCPIATCSHTPSLDHFEKRVSAWQQYNATPLQLKESDCKLPYCGVFALHARWMVQDGW